MNTLTFITILVLIVAVSSRHYEDRKQHEQLSDIEDHNEESLRHREHGEPRHRRRRWQMGYDYPPPQHGYYPDRRDYDRNQQDLSKIIRLLEEISDHLRRPQMPPPPPQPIYIPYPVPYPMQYYPCPKKCINAPNVTSRFPEMEDSNQNWGFVVPQEESEEQDTPRPINFDPIKPKRPMMRPQPDVEHGTNQGQASTASPIFAAKPASMCSAAILACCSDADQKQCFYNFGCTTAYTSDICTPDSISNALESIKIAYSPK